MTNVTAEDRLTAATIAMQMLIKEVQGLRYCLKNVAAFAPDVVSNAMSLSVESGWVQPAKNALVNDAIDLVVALNAHGYAIPERFADFN